MKFSLSSKIRKAVVAEADLNYVESITIDENLMRKAGTGGGEKVLVVSNSSGRRLEAYAIKGKKDS